MRGIAVPANQAAGAHDTRLIDGGEHEAFGRLLVLAASERNVAIPRKGHGPLALVPVRRVPIRPPVLKVEHADPLVVLLRDQSAARGGIQTRGRQPAAEVRPLQREAWVGSLRHSRERDAISRQVHLERAVLRDAAVLRLALVEFWHVALVPIDVGHIALSGSRDASEQKATVRAWHRSGSCRGLVDRGVRPCRLTLLPSL